MNVAVTVGSTERWAFSTSRNVSSSMLVADASRPNKALPARIIKKSQPSESRHKGQCSSRLK